jgi:hypothetical protein
MSTIKFTIDGVLHGIHPYWFNKALVHRHDEVTEVILTWYCFMLDPPAPIKSQPGRPKKEGNRPIRGTVLV